MKRILSIVMLLMFAVISYSQKVVFQNTDTDTLKGVTVNEFTSKRCDDVVNLYVTAKPIEGIADETYTIGTAAVVQGSFDGTYYFDLPNEAGDPELSTTINAVSGAIYPFALADYYKYSVGISATDTIRASISFMGEESVKTRRAFYGSLLGSNGFALDSIDNTEATSFAMPRVKPGDHVHAFAVTISDHTANIASVTIEVSNDGTNFVSAATAGETVEAGTTPDNSTSLYYVQTPYPYTRITVTGTGSHTNTTVKVFGKQFEIK